MDYREMSFANVRYLAITDAQGSPATVRHGSKAAIQAIIHSTISSTYAEPVKVITMLPGFTGELVAICTQISPKMIYPIRSSMNLGCSA